MPKVTPKIMYLDQLLQELQTGKLRIPSFQRPFEWSPEQMLKLLESVVSQYPIGSLLIWQADKQYRSLPTIGPHPVQSESSSGGSSYLLDGHQRMSTLAGTLLPLSAPHSPQLTRRWTVWYDLNEQKMKRMTTEDRKQAKQSPSDYVWWVPVYELLGSLEVHDRTSTIAASLGTGNEKTAELVKRLRTIATTFQRYAIPVNVVEDASLKEAVKIFSLLNTTGKRVSPDQVFTALTYQDEARDIATFFSEWLAETGLLGSRGFQNLQRAVLYRATLASLGRSIYESPWEAQGAAVMGTITDTDVHMNYLGQAMSKALEFMDKELCVRHPSVLPYGLQVIQLTEFFRVLGPDIEPTPQQQRTLLVSLWSAALSSAFNLGGSRRFDEAIELTRRLARVETSSLPGSNEPAWPLPRRFNPRSARVRAFFLFLASRAVDPSTGHRWADVLRGGLKDSQPVFRRQKRFDYECLENRVLYPSKSQVSLEELLRGLKGETQERRQAILQGLVIPEEALPLFEQQNQDEFWKVRRKYMIEQENQHILQLGLTPPGDDEDVDGENDADGEEVIEDID